MSFIRPITALFIGAALIVQCLPVLGQNPATSNIYGIHGYTGGANTLLNGRGAYSLDMVYSDAWVADAAYRTSFTNTMATAHSQGFTIIIRIDYAPCVVVPPAGDWNARYEFGERCKQIVNQLKPYCRIWVIGNEMQAGYCPTKVTKEWYTTVFGGDSNGVYDKIHSAQADAVVTFGGLGGWPGYLSEPDSEVSFMDYFCKNVGGKVDAFAVHAYNGPANQALGGSLDDPRSSDIGSFGAFRAFCDVIYSNFQHTKPVYITEWNSYWWIAGSSTPHSDESYEAGNIQKAYQAIDQWNRSSDLKIKGMCWYAFAHYGLCPNQNPGDWYNNALQPNRCTAAPRLDQARADFSWTTANTNYRSDVNSDGRMQIEAENYDNSVIWGNTIATGNQATDFNDSDTPNYGGQYRPDPVDIGAGGSGYFVGWTAPGEWCKYTLRGGRTAKYKLEMRYARAVGSGSSSVRVTVDGVQVGGTFSLADTGNWNTFQTATSPVFDLSNGVHNVRLIFDNGSINVDWFAFVPAPLPAAPTGLTATGVSTTQINLTWVDKSGVETNFVVARSNTSGGPFSDIATLPANTQSYSNTGLTANSTRYYIVRAINGSGSSANTPQAAATTWPSDIIMDNTATGFTASANWSTGTSAADKYGTDYRFRTTAAVSDAATWTYTAPQTRNYEVYAWWTAGTNRSTTVPYVITRTGGTSTVYKNQQTGGGAWQTLGIQNITGGTNTVKLSCWTSVVGPVVIGDAIKIVPR